MITSSPRSRAVAAYSNSRSGVRCAETTRTSNGTPRRSSVSAADLSVSQSDDEPMMMPTSAFTAALYINGPKASFRAHAQRVVPPACAIRRTSKSATSAHFASVRPSARIHQFAQSPEKPARGRGRARRVPFRACLSHQRAQLVDGRVEVQRLQLLPHSSVVGEQPVAPLLDVALAAQARSISVSAPIQSGANRLGVDFAHKLADELSLPHTGAAARDVACGDDRVVQRLGQIERIELCRRKLDQRLAERLEIERLAFTGALAGRLVGIVVGWAHPRNASTQGLRGGHC